MTNQAQRGSRVFIIVGSLLALGWLVTFVVPATREMLVGYAFSTLFNGLLIALFWRNARRGARRFWGLLAAAWSVGLLGNIVWGVLDTVVDTIALEGLATLSLVDLFYLARYGLVALALVGRVPASAQRWEAWIALAATATALVWLALYRPVLTTDPRPFSYFLGLAIYPVLDLPLAYIALLAWAYAPKGSARPTLGLIALAVLSYGIANWLNFSKRAVTLESYTHIADLFWFLSDVLTAGAALSARQRIGAMREQPTPRGLHHLPTIGALLTVAMTAGDLVVRRGRPDGVLIISSLVALVTLGILRQSQGAHPDSPSTGGTYEPEP
jgi:hypothetical protein